jgi:predicted RNA-binding Zn-ribbon protein involved in translation (DUF1610 family)
MNTSNNIYNILNKLASLEPQPPKQESMLKQLNEGATPPNPLSLKDRLAQKLAEAKEVDEDMLAKKDFDGDGKRESGKAEYMGSKDKAIKNAMGKKDVVDEAKEKTMSRAAKGHEKYGKEGMQALAKVGREGKDLDKVRAKYDKYNESVTEGETQGATKYTVAYKDNNKPGKSHSTQVKATSAAEAKAAFQEWDTTNRFTYLGSRPNVDTVYEGEYQDSPNKSAIPAFQRKAKAAPGDDSWKVNQQDLDDEASKSPTGSAGLAKAKERLGMNEELQADDGKHYDNADDFFSTIEGDWLDREEESDDGMEVRGYIDDVNVMVFRYDDESKTSGYGNYDDEGLNSEKEEQYDENNANSSLPGTRKTTEEEHSEYDAAAHTVRKWMRKRGWDPKSEFKPAMKYIMDNLDSKHDDTLTDEVKNACKKCAKHHETIDEAGLDMNLLKGAQGGMRGVNTDPESERNRNKKYGARSDRDDTGNDDDYDEYGNEKKGVKKSAPSDAPKTKGRPKKNFGPERTTAKAYKHKGSRVAESINIETYVEDTIAELEAIFVMEKAKSKAQQKFFGMVHAAQKGDKPASKEVADVAKDIGKKDAKDFAKTKHKGLPDKVEKKKVDESILTENTLQAIVRRFGKEVREFAQGGAGLDQDLFEALYDYYFDDMPYGVKKGRDGDPYEWVSDEFHNAIEGGDVEISETKVHDSLNELAKLAGLPSAMDEVATDEGNEFSGARANAIRAGKDSFEVGGKSFSVTDAEDEQVHEGGCNMTAEGQYCEMHGMNECGMMEGAKPDFLDVDKDGDEEESFEKAADDKEEGGSKLGSKAPQAKVSQHSTLKPVSNPKTGLSGQVPADKEKTAESADYEKQIPQGMDDKYVKFKCPSCGTATNASLMRGDNYTCPNCKKPLPAKNQMPLGECGDMGPMGGEPNTGMSINTSMDTKTGRKTVTVTADGEAAEELASILKMAGMVGAKKPEPQVISIGNDLDEYANEPDERTAPVSAVTASGNDLHKSKTMYKHSYKQSDNPMAVTENDTYLEARLARMLDRIKSSK